MAAHTSLESLGGAMRMLQDQFVTLIEPLRPALWRYCLRLTGSPWDAEDLVQETLAKAFARLAHYWQPQDPKPYLFRIATNTWIDGFRRARIAVDPLEEPLEGKVPDPAQHDPGATWAAMETLVTTLPTRQRVIVLLIDVFDFTAREAAEMIGSTEGAVKAALHRARETLRRTVATEGAASTPRVSKRVSPPSDLIARYLEAFNRRDPDALSALLAEDVVSDIVGVAEERGKEEARKNSLAEWAADPQPMWAEMGELEGREAVFVYFRTPEHQRALAWIITLETAGGVIRVMRNYCFCPDLILYAADLLGEPVSLYGYRYQPPAAGQGGEGA